MNKIVRTICLFTKEAGDSEIQKLNKIESYLIQKGYEVQTKRICLSHYDKDIDDKKFAQKSILLGLGTISKNELKDYLPDFIKSDNKSINLDLTDSEINQEEVESLFKIITEKPANTFNFTYSFNTPESNPFFPSAKFGKEGFSIGLQSTDLSEGCRTLDEWLQNTKTIWEEVYNLFKEEPDFLGIDSSVAPAFSGNGSLINFIKRIGYSFSSSVTTNLYTTITKFIKENNPKPIGLCGLMFPCLEDFELTEEYEKGNFSIERNIFLSLHSGVGIDTYPIGINQDKKKVIEILKLLQSLSNKYKKPLSVRFVSDGKAEIGQKTDFQNQYLKDVTIKEL